MEPRSFQEDSTLLMGSSYTPRRKYSVFGRYKAAVGGLSVNDDSEPDEQPHNRTSSLRVMGGFSLDAQFLELDDKVSISRLVDPQTGEFRVVKLNRGSMFRFYIWDLFHTLVDSPWYRLIILLVLSYFTAFNFFAVLYFMFSSFCIRGIPTYGDSLVFSMQIHMSIGYGEYNYLPTTECTIAILLVAFQCITALVMNAILFGLFYARFSRPSLRNQTLWFSKNAVISTVNNHKSLMFRIANIRKSEIANASVRVVMGFINKTRQGHWDYQFVTLPLSHSRDIMLAVPWTIVHPITKSSPLYKRTQAQLRDLNCEIICFIDGVNSSTGSSFQKRFSYLADEIVWNARFVNMLGKDQHGEWVVDYGCFHRIIPEDAVDHTDNFIVPGPTIIGTESVPIPGRSGHQQDEDSNSRSEQTDNQAGRFTVNPPTIAVSSASTNQNFASLSTATSPYQIPQTSDDTEPVDSEVLDLGDSMVAVSDQANVQTQPILIKTRKAVRRPSDGDDDKTDSEEDLSPVRRAAPARSRRSQKPSVNDIALEFP